MPKKAHCRNFGCFFSRTKNDKTKETVAIMEEELKRASLVKQVVVAECKAFEENYSCFSISNDMHNKETYKVHTHSDQYQKYLENFGELEEQQLLGTLCKYFRFFRRCVETISYVN